MDVFSDKFMKLAFSHATYYILLFLFLNWLLSLINFLQFKRFNPRIFFRAYWPGLVAALAMASVVFISVPAHPRVLSDETNILSVSKSMTTERRVDNVTEGRVGLLGYQALSRATEKRPLLTPFFYHLTNVFLGYDAGHAFVVNFIALALLFFLVYLLIQDAFGAVWGIAAIFLTASQPILSICAASNGIDFLNTIFVLIVFMSLREFLKNSSEASFLFLWMNLIMLAHARYESVIFFVLILAGLAVLKALRLNYFKTSLAFIFTPVFFLPIVVQRFLKWNDSELPGKTVPTAFGLDHFVKNNVEFFKNLFCRDFVMPFSALINLSGVAALIYFTVRFFLKKDVLKSAYDRKLVAIWLPAMAVLWIITTSYHFGHVGNPLSVRFFMTYFVFLSVLTAFLMAHASGLWKMNASGGLVIALTVFILYHPIAMQDKFSNTISSSREQRYILKFLKSRPDKNFLLISPLSNFFTPYNYGSISFKKANKKSKHILREYKERLYKDIYVAQLIDIRSGMISEGSELDNKYQLELIEELQIRSDQYFRISRVKNPR